jgi:hypothetical protein
MAMYQEAHPNYLPHFKTLPLWTSEKGVRFLDLHAKVCWIRPHRGGAVAGRFPTFRGSAAGRFTSRCAARWPFSVALLADDVVVVPTVAPHSPAVHSRVWASFLASTTPWSNCLETGWYIAWLCDMSFATRSTLSLMFNVSRCIALYNAYRYLHN